MHELIAVIPTQEEAQFKCQICLAQESNLYSFEDLLIIPSVDRQVPIAEALCEVTNETLENITNPYLPCQVCEVCVNQLRESYIFKLSFATSRLVWTEYLSQYGIDEVKKDKSEQFQSISIKVSSDNEERDHKTSDGEDFLKHFDLVRSKSPPLVDVKIRETHSLPNTSNKIHPCPFCTGTFTALELKKHIKSHDSLKSYLTAPGIPKYNKKVKFYAVPKDIKPLMSRSNPVMHKCIYCVSRLPAAEFRAHINEHVEAGSVTCDKCYLPFRNVQALRTHRVKHIKKQFTCKHCKKKFLDRDNYECHLLAHNNVFMYKCDSCGKEFANPKLLQRHRAKHRKKELDGIPECSQCLLRFNNPTEYANHKCIIDNSEVNKNTGQTEQMSECNEKDEDSNRRVLCQICGTSLYKNYLKQHLLRHTGTPSIKCEVCSKKFWRREYLKAHMRIHTGEKPYMCSYCGLTFSRLYNKQVHERLHIGVKNHVCHVCGKGFYEKSYLNRHFSRAHEKQTETEAKDRQMFIPNNEK